MGSPPEAGENTCSKSDRTGRDAAADLYRGEVGRRYHDLKRGLRPEALPWVMALRAQKFQPHIRPSNSVFEYGCGAAWNLANLQCARKLGYDASDFLGESVTKAGAEFVADPASIPPASIDVVIVHHALEHLLNPAKCLAVCHGLLKEDGRLILHVPWERERRYAVYYPDEPNHHLHGWNAQTLANLTRVCGFEPALVRTRRYGYDRFAANWAARTRTGQTGFKLLRFMLLAVKPLLEIELIATRARPLGWTTSWFLNT
jgi:SAM-dependent methyltransferase